MSHIALTVTFGQNRVIFYFQLQYSNHVSDRDNSFKLIC